MVLESDGGDSLPAALARLAPKGLLIWFGQASRPRSPSTSSTSSPRAFGGSIKHLDYTRSDRSYGQDLAVLVHLVETGRLHPEVGLRQNWSRTAEAIPALRARRIRARRPRGNAILQLP
nr:hypothetical protein [Streptacidiphilus sp. PB12-B1b]